MGETKYGRKAARGGFISERTPVMKRGSRVDGGQRLKTRIVDFTGSDSGTDCAALTVTILP
jgi:hypothetical protein